MGDVDHADALALEILHHAEQGLHLAKGEGAGGLVQDENLGLAHHSAQDLHKLLLGDGERICLALEVELEAQFLHVLCQTFFQFLGALMEAHEDVLLHRHVGEEHRLLRHHIDARRERGGRIGHVDRFSVNINLAAVGPVDAHDDLHERALPGAVAADKHQHVPGVEINAHALQYSVGAEGLGDVLYREGTR